MKNETIYITTTIPYVNSEPHIGFALELIQADALARYYRQCGKSVRLQTGTDDNAFKNVEAAQANNIEPQSWVNQNAAQFKRLCDSLNIEYDRFIRTSSPDHHAAVHSFWKQINPDDIYKSDYSGLYCSNCEDYYQEEQLVNGNCPEHGIPVQSVKEENYFFRLQKYQDTLHRLIDSDTIKITPLKRKNEILRFIERGLVDICISRDASRSGGWGVSVPNDSTQVVYVWIDALINYLSGIGEQSSWDDVWNKGTKKIHILGKNVWKFHAIYWPALLLSAGLCLPDELQIHGFLTVDGKKIGKSLGNAISPFECIESLNLNAVKHALIKPISPFEDSDYSNASAQKAYNSDLANGLGNLFSRLTRLAERSHYIHVPENLIFSELSSDYHEAFQEHDYQKALGIPFKRIRDLNKAIDQEKPWLLLKCSNSTQLHKQLKVWLKQLHTIALELSPVFEEECVQIINQLVSNKFRLERPLFARIYRTQPNDG